LGNWRFWGWSHSLVEHYCNYMVIQNRLKNPEGYERQKDLGIVTVFDPRNLELKILTFGWIKFEKAVIVEQF
jgi:hypothetical protein